METLTKAFMWVAAGLASCMVAHALMIPTGIEQWLHTTFGKVSATTVLPATEPVFDLTG